MNLITEAEAIIRGKEILKQDERARMQVRVCCDGKPRNARRPRTEAEAEKLLFKLRWINPITGCWHYCGDRDDRGYGRLRVSGRLHHAHRFAFIRLVRDPQALNVLHQCDNPPCFNPEHLFAGTQKDNIQDCAAKGRHRYNPNRDVIGRFAPGRAS